MTPTFRTFLFPAAALLALGLLTACGSGSEDGSDVVGVYSYDVARTTGVGAPPAGTAIRLPREAADAHLVQALGPDAYLLTLRSTGAFELRIVAQGEIFIAAGTWSRTSEGVTMVTESMNGEPLEADVENTSRLRVEGGGLVIDEEGRRVYLRRL